MGLKSNARNGVKAQLRDRVPDAFKEFDTLVDARNASSATREEAFACIDGNVLMMSVPQSCRTFDAYVGIVYSSLLKAIATAIVTVVVFDDPSAMTEAKLEEQRRRDSARAATTVVCSTDMCGTNADDFTKEYILQASDVHTLKQGRGTRMRFFDEVAMTVMDRLKLQISKWEKGGHVGGHVVMDGIDSRGAGRGIGEVRDNGFVSSSEGLGELFRRSTMIGEGDLKLADLGRRVRELSNSGVQDLSPCQKVHAERLKRTKLIQCTTIDTDSFAIELIEEARRSAQPNTSPANTLLCMRERAKKRGCDDDRDPFYLCCDIALLHASLQRHMWGISRSPGPIDQRAAITLLVAGWCMCGCDFVEIKGMRSDVVFESIGEIVKTHSDSVGLMQHSWQGERETLALTHKPIRQLLTACATKLIDIPRIKKDFLTNVRQPDQLVLNKVGWLCAYWNSCEHHGSMEDFGFLKQFST
jgi:hypothetical protein